MEKKEVHHTLLTCPELGAQDDPSISCAYPSIQNTCFHCQKMATPSLSHQSEYCLSSLYVRCPVYLLRPDTEFPVDLQYKLEPENRKTFPLLLTIVIILIFSVLVFLSLEPLSNLAERQPALTGNYSLTIQPTRTKVFPPTSTQPNPSATLRPKPTLTNTLIVETAEPVIKRTLDLPFTIGETNFIIHRVLDGETLAGLASKYSTSIEAIEAINVIIPSPLWVGRILVISPGMINIDPALPAFEPYEVPDKEIALADLSGRMKVDVGLLKYYTLCGEPCVFVAGEWLIIPRLR